jgi:RHS repeat-associated protein
MMVARAEAKGEYGRQEARWDYVARCAPPIFPSPAVATHTSFRHTPSRPWSRTTATVWRNLEQDPRRGETFTFSAKEKDVETGLSYFGSRYYSSDLSIWLSVDPQASKYPSLSPYVYCANNPVKLVDPDGEENLYAFHYAQRNLLNKVKSVKDISTESWYGYSPGQHQTLTKQDPTKGSCYGIVWHAYMNSGDKITSYLQTGFSDKNNYFKGRELSKQWFKQGNSSPANQDGLSRSFETDIMKGEIGDIVFMEGHAAMLAGLPEQIEEDGNTYVKLKVYTTTSNCGFIEQDIIFDSDRKNRTTGWSGFEGYGQLHQTQGKGNPDLE